jgi:hypothetical protein
MMLLVDVVKQAYNALVIEHPEPDLSDPEVRKRYMDDFAVVQTFVNDYYNKFHIILNEGR